LEPGFSETANGRNGEWAWPYWSYRSYKSYSWQGLSRLSSPQCSHAPRIEDENDDEYEDEPPKRQTPNAKRQTLPANREPFGWRFLKSRDAFTEGESFLLFCYLPDLDRSPVEEHC
jgi:hypothetical protein